MRLIFPIKPIYGCQAKIAIRGVVVWLSPQHRRLKRALSLALCPFGKSTDTGQTNNTGSPRLIQILHCSPKAKGIFILDVAGYSPPILDLGETATDVAKRVRIVSTATRFHCNQNWM